jgi:hypothetical protein
MPTNVTARRMRSWNRLRKARVRIIERFRTELGEIGRTPTARLAPLVALELGLVKAIP